MAVDACVQLSTRFSSSSSSGAAEPAVSVASIASVLSDSSAVVVPSGSASGDSLMGLEARLVGDTEREWLTGGEVT